MNLIAHVITKGIGVKTAEGIGATPPPLGAIKANIKIPRNNAEVINPSQ
jgi:hypothetical protein